MSQSTDSPSFGFPPIADAHINTLILGSLPSRLSINSGQYYGNPRNAFWPLMASLLNFDPALPYEKRTATLLRARIGVWDVLQSSHRPGSLDASIDISSAQANDFASFFVGHPQLARLCFNGAKAADLFRRFDCLPSGVGTIDVEQIKLPSTSPAHAAMNFEEKCRRWSVVTQPLKALR